jgi:hypothetical protein
MLMYKYFLLFLRHSGALEEDSCKIAGLENVWDIVKCFFCRAIHGDYFSWRQKGGAGTILQVAQPLESSSVGATE